MLRFDSTCKRPGGPLADDALIRLSSLANNTIDPIGLCVEGVVAQFVIDEDERDDARGGPHCESECVDKGVEFVADQIAEGDSEVV